MPKKPIPSNIYEAGLIAHLNYKNILFSTKFNSESVRGETRN